MQIIALALAASTASYLVRDSGSFVVGLTRDKTDNVGGEAIRDFLGRLDWQEITENVRTSGNGFGQCRYFEASVPKGTKAFEAIALWGELTDEERYYVDVRRSPHASAVTGYLNELVSPLLTPNRTGRLVLIIGNKDAPDRDPAEAPTVYMWAPGRITPFRVITDEMVETHTFPEDATVKLEG